jgi:hypothetical protein
MVTVMKIILLFMILSGTWKTTRDKKKISQAALGLKVLQNVTEIVDILHLLFNKELIDTVVEEINRYAEQFLHRHKLSNRPTATAWKSVTEGEI